MTVPDRLKNAPPLFQLFYGVDTDNLDLVSEAIKNGVDANQTLEPGEYDSLYETWIGQKRNTAHGTIDEPKMTALLLALSMEHLGVAECLIKNSNSDPNLQNGFHISPLYMLLMVDFRGEGHKQKADFDQKLLNLCHLLVGKGASLEDLHVGGEQTINYESDALVRNYIPVFDYLCQLSASKGSLNKKTDLYHRNVRDYLSCHGLNDAGDLNFLINTAIQRLNYIMSRSREWRESVDMKKMISPAFIKRYLFHLPKNADAIVIQGYLQFIKLCIRSYPNSFDKTSFSTYLADSHESLNEEIETLLTQVDEVKREGGILSITELLNKLKLKIEREPNKKYKNAAQGVYDKLTMKLDAFRDQPSMTSDTLGKSMLQDIKSALPQFNQSLSWPTFFHNVLRTIANLFLAKDNQYSFFEPQPRNGLNLQEEKDTLEQLTLTSNSF